MMAIVKKIGQMFLFTLIMVGLIFLLSYGIGLVSDYNVPDVAFVVALIIIVVGAFSLMGGNGIRSRTPFPGNEQDVTGTILELEREMQDIRTQGSKQYVAENRIISLSAVKFVFVISGIASIVIINVVY
ncbi:hypothetical protein [Paenibacillus thermotolerans]|uniref:hypothetical protein n=1 Tax=Paenibacillus thermotolerans TaxID=3027807 RepID=UPI0023681F33|nr:MULTISPECIES: hypothetical protein [unclassified Paenibacillus]